MNHHIGLYTFVIVMYTIGTEKGQLPEGDKFAVKRVDFRKFHAVICFMWQIDA